MTLSAVGETTMVDSRLLNPDWHKDLKQKQLAAYLRYQYLWLKENASDWDSRTHSVRRNRWDGGQDSIGNNYKSTWAEIGRLVRELDADPGMWVHAHFSPAAELRLTSAMSLPEMRPTFLYAQSSPVIYGRYLNSLRDVLMANFDMAGRTIRDRFITSESLRLSSEEQQLYVLCDESYVTATPFFRHAFAASGNCSEAISHYLWLAALDYEVHQRAYDYLIEKHNENWWLTDNLITQVVKIRKHWENYNG